MSTTDLHILYRFYDPAGRLLYVGLTSDPGHRIEQHRREKSWWLDVARMEVEHCVSRSELVEAERRAIQRERPLHNVRGAEVADKAASGSSGRRTPRPRRTRSMRRPAPPLTRLDIRVFAWLLDRWHGGDRSEPRVEFTLSELGRAVYDRAIGAGERDELQASLHRLRDPRSVSATWWSRLLAGVGWSGNGDKYAANLSGYTLEQAQAGQLRYLDAVLRAALDSGSQRHRRALTDTALPLEIGTRDTNHVR